MRSILIVFLMLCGVGLTAQTPYATFSSSNEKGRVSANQVSLANVWVGSKLSYSVDQDAPLDANFLFTAKILYVPVSGDRWALPLALIASPTGGDILIPESGLNIGIFPWYKLISKDQFTLLAHGGVSYKSLKEEGSPEVNQVRALAGLEIAFAGKDGGAPITLSANPVYSHTEGLGNKTAMELTAILPLAKSLGILVDYQDNAFRVGVIVGVNAMSK